MLVVVYKIYCPTQATTQISEGQNKTVSEVPPGKTRYPFYSRLGGPQGRSGRAKNFVPTGIRSRTIQPVVSKGKSVPLQGWSGPEGSRKLKFPYFVTTAQDGGMVVSLRHRPSLPPGNVPGTHFC